MRRKKSYRHKKAIELKPNRVFYLSLGDTYQKQGNLDEAARAYEESIKIKPTFVSGLYNLALVYAKKERVPEAIELLRKVVDIGLRSIFGQHALGMLYVQTGNKTAAMQQYYILKDLDPKLAADLLMLIPKRGGGVVSGGSVLWLLQDDVDSHSIFELDLMGNCMTLFLIL